MPTTIPTPTSRPTSSIRVDHLGTGHNIIIPTVGANRTVRVLHHSTAPTKSTIAITVNTTVTPTSITDKEVTATPLNKTTTPIVTTLSNAAWWDELVASVFSLVYLVNQTHVDATHDRHRNNSILRDRFR